MMNRSYHMIEYIHEIPEALSRTLAENDLPIQQLVERAKQNQVNKIIIFGLGSSYTAALMATPLFRRYCPLPAYILPSTEFGPIAPGLVDQHTLVISVSRSGERGWVVDALKEAILRGATGVAVTGVRDSLLAKNAQTVLVTCEGPEITFAKTKSVATCSGLLMQLALAFARPDDQEAADQLDILKSTPALLQETILAVEPQILSLIPEIQTHKMVMAGGTVGNYGAAMEFAVKLPEAANIPVIGNDTGNMLHGPWGRLDSEWLIVLLVTCFDYKLSTTTLDLAGNLKGHRLAIAESGVEIGSHCEYKIVLPNPVDLITSGLTYLIPLQILTYYWTISNGLNPDAPADMRIMLDSMLPPGREEPELRGSVH